MFLVSALVVLGTYNSAAAETKAIVRLDVKHSVGGISEFDREKYITVHSSLTEGDWEGEEQKLDYLINDLDVYFGRDNGIMILYSEQVEEDPKRSGYADPEHMELLGKSYREDFYGKQFADRHEMDAKNDVMIGGQVRTFWSAETNPHGGGKAGWSLAGVDAAGEYMGHFLNEFYRDAGDSPLEGSPRPKYLEILNEPLYELIDGNKGSQIRPKEIFEYHNHAAEAIRRVNDTTMIGGYTAAFPILEERDFARWNERMKLFIDTSGEYMDFFSLHFYDFNMRGRRGRDYYKGGRIEATLDMIEQYSLLQLGEVKPFVISEYGGRDHKLERGQWSPLRDWQFMKAFSPLMLSFMDRPNVILKSIPFIVAKAEWGTKDNIPYNWRLLRQAKEGEGESGNDWVFTEQIKFYELWSEVDGTRVHTRSTNPDVLTDCYVDGRHAYLILSNLNPSQETVQLSLLGQQLDGLRSVEIKHLHLAGDAPQLEIFKQDKAPKSFVLDQEATAIIKYTFDRDIAIKRTAFEAKYYATDYHKPIDRGAPINFDINDVEVSHNGEAVLRIAFGRETSLSRYPTVSFNGRALTVPINYSGSEQPNRASFFGMLEIPVPYKRLRAKNQIEIAFPDAGGSVSSVTMQVLSAK
ncbi:MAG: beta-agarase [Opitutaceae bacterium]